MLKTTLIGGVLFLVPFGILLLVLHEILMLALVVVDPIASLFPADDYWGISLALVLAVLLILLLCFLAGLAARHAAVSGFSTRTEQFLEHLIPGYDMLRVRIAGALSPEQASTGGKVVSLTSAGLKRYGFLIEKLEDTGEALVFLPGAPDSESGVLGRVALSDLTFENIPTHRVHQAFRFYGRGLHDESPRSE